MSTVCEATAPTEARQGDDGRPSVLAVTSQLPWPLNTGGHLRTFHLLRALSRRCRLRLVAPITAEQQPLVETLREQGLDVRPVLVGPRRNWREGLRAVAATVRSEPYVLYRRHDRAAVRATLRQLAQQDTPDVFYLDHLDSFAYRALLPETPAVIDLHNVYSMLVRRAGAEQSSWLKRCYLSREAALLAQKEGQVACTVNALCTVSEEEQRYFTGLGARSVTVVPNGVDCSAYADLPTGRLPTTPTILYVGALSWGPNASAAVFLAKEVLPRVRMSLPEARLRIVGRDPSPEILALSQLPGVDVLGSVPDVIPHLREASVLAVPLEAGGGTRLKILEAFAAGLPVLSTAVGCEGIRATNGEQLFVAERPAFADSLVSLLRDPARGEQLAERARDLARQRYDWNIVGEAALEVVEGLSVRSLSAKRR